jgi:hypothetical protein
MVSDLTLHRRAFWMLFAERSPALHARTLRGNETTRWLAVGSMPLIVAHYIAGGGVGIFVRGARGTRIGLVREYLFPHRDFLAQALGRPELRLGSTFLLNDRLRIDTFDKANWPRAIDWLAVRSAVYEQALARLQRR